MSTFLNSIFFIKKEHLNLSNVLNVLRDFMFTRLKQIAVISNSNLIINDFLGKKNFIEDESEDVDIVNKVIENRLLDYPVEIKETIPEKPKEEEL
jgi:hypothetical protein